MGRKKSERLTPKPETLRELYLKSGNQCAFPGCSNLLVNKDGIFIGQVCHIEAADSGGERYNAALSPEDRRAFANLMLMCYEHHTVTNDVVKYPVSVLREMKATHESKFTDVVAAIQDAIADHSMKTDLRKPQTLKRFMGPDCDLTDDQLQFNIRDMAWVADKVRMLPIRTRQLLSVVVSRLGRTTTPAGHFCYETSVLMQEVGEACNLRAKDIIPQLAIMEKYRIGREIDGDPSGRRIGLRETPEMGWFVWGGLRDFCEKEDIPLQAILVDLRFDLLD